MPNEPKSKPSRLVHQVNVSYLVRAYGITGDQARRLIGRIGKNRAKLGEAARILKARLPKREAASTPRNQPADGLLPVRYPTIGEHLATPEVDQSTCALACKRASFNGWILEPDGYQANAAAQTRLVSKARIGLDSRKSVRSFKEIICVDISEIAVGTLITERPPHRTERAPFGHSAPTSGV